MAKVITLEWIQAYHSRLMEYINKKISGSASGIAVWTSGVTYEKDSLVIYNNKIYKADNNNTSTTFDSTQWSLIGGDSDVTLSDIDFDTWS